MIYLNIAIYCVLLTLLAVLMLSLIYDADSGDTVKSRSGVFTRRGMYKAKQKRGFLGVAIMAVSWLSIEALLKILP